MHAQSCPALWNSWTITHQTPFPWNFPGKNTGVGCHFLLQGILPTEGSNLHFLGLLHRFGRFFTTEPAAAAAKSLQSFPTLCDPRDSSPPGSPIPGILQARTLEWVAIAFSNAWKWKVKVKSLETPNSLYSILILPAAWTSQPCTSHFYKTLMDTWSPYSFQRYPIDLTF